MRKFVLIFMYDILVFSKTLEEHIEHLKLVFQTLLNNQLFIKFNKLLLLNNKLSTWVTSYLSIVWLLTLQRLMQC
jgi:hypothetical protein